MTDRTCLNPECASVLAPRLGGGAPRKYCSRVCRRRHVGPDSPTRTCGVAGCRRAMRAKGLCGTHYNQTLPQRHKKRQVSCTACGKSLAKVSSGDRRAVCSYRCRSFLQYGRWPDEGKELVGPVLRRSRYPRTSPVMELPKVPRAFTQGRCAQCGDIFTRVNVGTTTPARYCSARCSKRAGGGFKISDKRRRAIYDRDGWICQLCFEPVEPGRPSLDDWAPSLDHIIPQSHMLVPDHSDGNLRLSHRWCNAVRGDDTYYTAADLAA